MYSLKSHMYFNSILYILQSWKQFDTFGQNFTIIGMFKLITILSTYLLSVLQLNCTTQARTVNRNRAQHTVKIPAAFGADRLVCSKKVIAAPNNDIVHFTEPTTTITYCLFGNHSKIFLNLILLSFLCRTENSSVN